MLVLLSIKHTADFGADKQLKNSAQKGCGSISTDLRGGDQKLIPNHILAHLHFH
jgi:hypothetical protein